MLGLVRSEIYPKIVLKRFVPIFFRNIFRVAFLLSCHIFDCYGISDACLAGDPSRFRSVFLRSNSDIVYQSAVNVKHFLRLLRSFQLGVSDQVASRSAARDILALLSS